MKEHGTRIERRTTRTDQARTANVVRCQCYTIQPHGLIATEGRPAIGDRQHTSQTQDAQEGRIVVLREDAADRAEVSGERR